MKKALPILPLLLLLSTFACKTDDSWVSEAENPRFLHRSVKQVTDVIVHDIFSPPVAGRIYQYVSVAAYEAAIPADSTLLTMANQVHGLQPLPRPDPNEKYCFTLASSIATLEVGRALVFSEEQIESFKTNILNEFKATGIPKDVFARSVEFGNEVARHIIEWADEDNYKQTRSFPKYTITNDPYAWKPTPPAYMDGIEPHWNKIRTAVLDSAGQFRPIPGTPFSTEKNSQFYRDALETYELGNNLSPDSMEIAAFWDCNPFVMNVKGHVMFATKKISPAGHWMNITGVICSDAKTTTARAAEAYARTAIAMSEGFISCWNEKYKSKLIRPETYINQYIDENWVPFLQTPPFPEYTSGHSVVSSAASVVLTDLFGENFAFTDSTEVEYGLTVRKFTSLNHAAEEAAISRLYGGIHYRPAVVNGAAEGKAIGKYVVANLKTRRNPTEAEVVVVGKGE